MLPTLLCSQLQVATRKPVDAEQRGTDDFSRTPQSHRGRHAEAAKCPRPLTSRVQNKREGGAQLKGGSAHAESSYLDWPRRLSRGDAGRGQRKMAWKSARGSRPARLLRCRREPNSMLAAHWLINGRRHRNLSKAAQFTVSPPFLFEVHLSLLPQN